MKLNTTQLTTRLQEANRGTFILLIILEASVVLGLGWLLLLNREVQSIQASGALGYQDAVLRLEQAEQRLAELKQMEQAYEDLSQERLAQVDPVLPIGLNPPAVISNIESFASSTGLEILSIDVVQPETVDELAPPVTEEVGAPVFSDPNIQTATITLNVDSEQGSYNELKRFLDTLESFVPVYDLRTISYVPDTTSFALQLQTYYLAEDEALNTIQPVTNSDETSF